MVNDHNSICTDSLQMTGTTRTRPGKLGHEQSDEQGLHSRHHTGHCKWCHTYHNSGSYLHDRSATRLPRAAALHRVHKPVKYVTNNAAVILTATNNSPSTDLLLGRSRSMSDWYLGDSPRGHVLRSNHSPRALAAQIRRVQSLFPRRDRCWSTQPRTVSRASVLQGGNVRVWSP